MKRTYRKTSDGSKSPVAHKKRGVVVSRANTPKERLNDSVSTFVTEFYGRHKKVMTKLAYE